MLLVSSMLCCWYDGWQCDASCHVAILTLPPSTAVDLLPQHNGLTESTTAAASDVIDSISGASAATAHATIACNYAIPYLCTL